MKIIHEKREAVERRIVAAIDKNDGGVYLPNGCQSFKIYTDGQISSHCSFRKLETLCNVKFIYSDEKFSLVFNDD